MPRRANDKIVVVIYFGDTHVHCDEPDCGECAEADRIMNLMKQAHCDFVATLSREVDHDTGDYAAYLCNQVGRHDRLAMPHERNHVTSPEHTHEVERAHQLAVDVGRVKGESVT